MNHGINSLTLDFIFVFPVLLLVEIYAETIPPINISIDQSDNSANIQKLKNFSGIEENLLQIGFLAFNLSIQLAQFFKIFLLFKFILPKFCLLFSKLSLEHR